jgi:hypothetical protein
MARKTTRPIAQRQVTVDLAADATISHDWYASMAGQGVEVDPHEGVSSIFHAFAEPLLEEACDSDDLHVGYTIAMIAWNIAITPALLRPHVLARCMNTMPLELHVEMRRRITRMVTRKEQYYGQHAWLVRDFHLKDLPGDDIELSVVAMVVNFTGMARSSTASESVAALQVKEALG